MSAIRRLAPCIPARMCASSFACAPQSAIKLASWTLDAAKLLDSLVAGGERAGFMRTYVYDSFVKPYAKSGASCIDQGEQDHMLRALEGSVSPLLAHSGIAHGPR